jgi:hypothetical protein
LLFESHTHVIRSWLRNLIRRGVVRRPTTAHETARPCRSDADDRGKLAELS